MNRIPLQCSLEKRPPCRNTAHAFFSVVVFNLKKKCFYGPRENIYLQRQEKKYLNIVPSKPGGFVSKCTDLCVIGPRGYFKFQRESTKRHKRYSRIMSIHSCRVNQTDFVPIAANQSKYACKVNLPT